MLKIILKNVYYFLDIVFGFTDIVLCFSDIVFLFLDIVSKGISGNLLKHSSKRRRSKAQLKEEALQAELQKQQVAKKIAAFDEMAAKVHEMNRKLNE